MKKTLVALAVLASTGAFAQSTVTLSGLFDIGYGSVNGPANVLGVQTGDIRRVAQNGSATSAILLGGVEDLGGGMKALFRYEINPDLVGGSGFSGGAGATSATTGAISLGSGANGYHFVGVEGGFGKVLFGRLNTGSLSAWGAGSTFGTALGSGYGSNGNIYTRYSSSAGNFNNTAPTRFNGAVEYTTPVVGGLSARLLLVPQVNKITVGGESACAQTACTSENAFAAGANRAGVTDISVAFSQGPLNVVVASQTLKVGSGDVSALVSPSLLSTANTSNKLNTVGANYNLGFATVRGGFWTEKTGTTVNTSGYQLGASYPMGAMTLHASIANSNDKTTANVDRKIMGLGADYALSKRSTVYGRYENRDMDTSSAAKAVDAAASGSTKVMHVGVRHSF
jgi:predicted porin